MNDFDTPTNVMHGEVLHELTERLRERKPTGELMAPLPIVIEMEADHEEPPPILLQHVKHPPKRPSRAPLIALMLAIGIGPAAVIVGVEELRPIIVFFLAHFS